ncbi:8923_t:CDS:2 [Scutellospora calospora]|uniref:8923_t:CDS:1 n=1 Tax=Scutellospora calospora TaxID=85575 RepID=A0ACA9JU97_9GLOM|nr:8923_t:CDS:2 [Scutellospora calospora]
MASDAETKDSTLNEEKDTKVDPTLKEEPEMTQELQIKDDLSDTNEEKLHAAFMEKMEKRKRNEPSTKESQNIDDEEDDENKSDENIEQPPTKKVRSSPRKTGSTVSKRKQTSTSILSSQSSPKRGRGRKPSIKFDDEELDELRHDRDDDDDYRVNDSDYEEMEKKPSMKKSKGKGQYMRKRSWRAEEDNYMIDCILEEMPSPSWARIAKGLDGRTPNSCLVRWKTLQKRLYQNML